MNKTDAINASAKVLEDASNDLAVIHGKISRLNSEKLQVANTPPHTDDVIATFLRGVHGTAIEFERQMKAHLKKTFVAAGKFGAAAGSADPGRSADVLTIPSVTAVQDVMPGGPQPLPVALNMGALTYLLRDRLEAEIPALVQKLCPEAARGVRHVDRVAALAKLDEEIAALNAEAVELNASLNVARKAVLS